MGAEIATILTKAMAQNPELRYRSAAEFREALRRVGRRAPNRPRYQPYLPAVFYFPKWRMISNSQTFHKSTSRKSNPAFITSVVLMLLVAAAGLFTVFRNGARRRLPHPTVNPRFVPPAGDSRKVPVTNATRFVHCGNRCL